MVSVAVELVDGTKGHGAGTLIETNGRHGVVLTCSHIVRGVADDKKSIIVQWGGGYRSYAYIIADDPDRDLCALLVAPPEGAAVIPVADDDTWPEAGDYVECTGFGRCRWRRWRSRVMGYTKSGPSGRCETVVSTGNPISGDSGGAMVHRGRLAGVIWGGRDSCHATYSQEINAFIHDHNARCDRSQAETTPPPPPIPPAPTTTIELDYDRLADAIMERHGARPP